MEKTLTSLEVLQQEIKELEAKGEAIPKSKLKKLQKMELQLEKKQEQQKIREEKEERERKEKEKKQEEFIMTKPKSDFPLYIQFKQIPKEADIPITIKACVESVDSLGFIVLTDTSSTIQVVLSKE